MSFETPPTRSETTRRYIRGDSEVTGGSKSNGPKTGVTKRESRNLFSKEDETGRRVHGSGLIMNKSFEVRIRGRTDPVRSMGYQNGITVNSITH